MGIGAALIRFLKLRHGSQNTTDNDKVTHLFVDMNAIVHYCLRKSYGKDLEKVIGDSVVYKLRSIQHQLPNVESIFLCFDGPGTRSKITMQRQRRKRGEDGRAQVIKTDITPGTPFMGAIKQRMIEYAKNTMHEVPKIESIYVSATDRYGEGEFKIFEYIHSRKWPSNTCIAISSDDSDTKLYAMLTDVNIYVKGMHEMLNISGFKKGLANTVPHRDAHFAFLNSLRGNDLVPGLVGYHFESTWDGYAALESKEGLYNMQTREINWSMFIDVLNCNEFVVSSLIKSLEKRLQRKLGHSVKVVDNNAMVNLDGKTYGPFEVPKHSRGSSYSVYLMLMDSNHPVWQGFFKTLSGSDMLATKARIDAAYAQITPQLPIGSPPPPIDTYIEGLVWHMDYIHGKCTNFEYYYPTQSGPRIQDLKRYSINTPATRAVLQVSLPLTPLQFNLALSHENNIQRVNPIFHPMYQELEHFHKSEDVSFNAWSQPGALEALRESFMKHLKVESLTEFESGQLQFSPTTHFFKVKDIIYRREEMFQAGNQLAEYTQPEFVVKVKAPNPTVPPSSNAAKPLGHSTFKPKPKQPILDYASVKVKASPSSSSPTPNMPFKLFYSTTSSSSSFRPHVPQQQMALGYLRVGLGLLKK
eukprot:gene218-266_t